MDTVGIADLKARLSEYLRRVRRGHPVVVLDRDTPVARLVPYRSERDLLRFRRPLKPVRSLRSIKRPPAVKTKIDVVALLREERRD